MKDRLFFDDEFEKQLKEKADQFKMYPSDNVWSEVYSSIHTRRKRFVAGMTFLIGGILILAGTQLIFPTKNTLTKTVALKPGNPVKPSTEAGFRNFTAGSLVSPAQDISGNLQDPGNGLNTSSSFKGRYEEFNNQKYAAGLSSEFIHGNIETNTYPKIIQPEELNLSEKSNASLAEAEKDESIQIASIVPVLKPTADDLAPEKTLTQLSHYRVELIQIAVFDTQRTAFAAVIHADLKAQSIG